MKRLKLFSSVLPLFCVACDSTSADVDEAKLEVANETGILFSDANFTNIHYDEGTVCGEINGYRFLSLDAGNRTTAVLDGLDVPDTVRKVVEDGYVECMNSVRAV